uniref:Uncharacterized protein n=1 Tax=Anguilla anguilla TaxID=7936 RepID=A0A0E9VW39_ANGAN
MNHERFFRSSVSRTRGHKWKLAKGKFHTDIRKSFGVWRSQFVE